MSIQIIVPVLLIAAALGYSYLMKKRITGKVGNASPEELEAMRREGARTYRNYFATEEDEELIHCITGPVYSGDQIEKDSKPGFLKDIDISDSTLYAALTDRNRLLVVTQTQNRLESAVGNSSLNTWEIPLESELLRGETLFPGGKNTKKVSPIYPALDLYVVKLPENKQFGIWASDSEAEAFAQNMMKAKAGIDSN